MYHEFASLIYFITLISGDRPASFEQDKTLVQSGGDNHVAAPVGKSWSLHCPHLSSNSYKLKVEWTHNARTVVKIRDGKVLPVLGHADVPRCRVDHRRSVCTITLQKRYHFVYNEVTGDFSLTIDRLRLIDEGLWQCVVNYTISERSTKYFRLQKDIFLNVINKEGGFNDHKIPDRNDESIYHRNTGNIDEFDRLADHKDQTDPQDKPMSGQSYIIVSDDEITENTTNGGAANSHNFIWLLVTLTLLPTCLLSSCFDA